VTDSSVTQFHANQSNSFGELGKFCQRRVRRHTWTNGERLCCRSCRNSNTPLNDKNGRESTTGKSVW